MRIGVWLLKKEKGRHDYEGLMTVLDKSGQVRMKIRFRKHQHSSFKEKSLTTVFLDLVGKVKHKGSEKCKNYQGIEQFPYEETITL